MTRIPRSFSLVILLAACAAKPDVPTIQLTDVGFTLHLPAPMQQALDSIAPGFHTIRTTSYRSDVSQAALAGGGGGMPALFAALGDFNHDGTPDAVVEGTAPGDSALRVIVILNGTKPTALDVARFATYDADAVGIYLTGPPAGQDAAFEVVNYPDESTLYRYADGAFEGTKVGS